MSMAACQQVRAKGQFVTEVLRLALQGEPKWKLM